MLYPVELWARFSGSRCGIRRCAHRCKRSKRNRLTRLWNDRLTPVRYSSREVGRLRETDGVLVYEKCDKCGRECLVDLDALIDEFGPRYTLWNRRSPCLTEGCEGRRWYRAQPRNYFHRIMMDAPPAFVAELHERWKASLHPDVRDDFPVIPMLQATDQVVIAGCLVSNASTSALSEPAPGRSRSLFPN